MALVRAKGGTSVYIPAKVKRSHWLARLVGHEAANAIAAHYRIISGEGRYNGIWLLIPMASSAQKAERWNEVLTDPELSASDTARTMGVHERTVFRRRAQRRQGELF